MRVRFNILLLLLCLCSLLMSAQDKPPYDVNTTLSDATYIINRFEEATEGFHVQVDSWKIPDSTKKSMKDAFDAEFANIETEKPALNALLRSGGRSSVDLFDVYQTLETVGFELYSQSDYYGDYANNQETSLALVQLANKARLVNAKLGVILRAQLVQEGSQLGSCTTKAGSRK